MSALTRKRQVQEAWAALLATEEVTAALSKMLAEVTTQRMMRVDSIDCPRCRGMRKVDVNVEVYPLRDALALMDFLAKYGIGTPVEEKEVRVDITARTVQELQTASSEELLAIVEGEYRELPA